MDVITAFLLTFIAGICTVIGAVLAMFTKSNNDKFLSVSLGFSAGVMIYVSMIEIFFKAQDALINELGFKLGSWANVLAFFGGIIVIAIIDYLIPSEGNPHEIKSLAHSKEVDEDEEAKTLKQRKLMRMGLFMALAIGIHNFPEGLATFMSALQDPHIAIPIVVAIGIHNIPEGIAVAVPIYQATNSKKKAILYALYSGMAEPIGALVGYGLLQPIMSDTLFGIIFAMVAGIMVFISLDELLPAAREYGEHHLSIYGLVIGMFVMALSLLLFL